ncbi:MAG: transcriptional regulator [Pseudanabaena sp.]|nr:MAG: transcriptional regulator [Pseudanabaena sp.]
MKLQVKNYANLIRELQDRLDLTQEQLAKQIGTSRWRNGHHQTSPMAINLLRQAVNDLGDRGADLQQYF